MPTRSSSCQISFELRVDEEPVDVVWDAYTTRMTLMLGSKGHVQAWPITAADLEAALAADHQFTMNTGNT